jgi:hypothetical protein
MLMTSWIRYINEKFVPQAEFTFKKEQRDCLNIIHNKSGTSFHFYLSADEEELFEVQYGNLNTKGWSGEFERNAKFSFEECKVVDAFLKPAFETGWISEDTYISKRHWKSTVYFNLNRTGAPFKYYSAEKGCLSLLLFPIFELYAEMFGIRRIIIVDPVRKKY